MHATGWNDPRGRLVAAGALLALLVLAFAFQGIRGLWSPDEGRYVDVALEMLSSGDWVHPRLHHEVAHFTKPPLTYWLLGTSIGAFGASEWAARAPNALAWLFTVLMVFAAARHLEPRQPWLPPLIYAAFLLPYLAANVVTTDTVLAAMVALYAYGFIAAGMARDPRERAIGGWALWLGAALAFLTKGPPALLPLAGLLAFAWTQRAQRPLRASYFPAAPLWVAAILASAWYVKVGMDQPQLVRYFLIEEVWHRVASDATHRNAQWYAPLTIYLPTLLLGTLPWCVPLLSGAARALRAPRQIWADHDARRLLLWFGLPLVVFVLARSRLPFYLLPLFLPLAFITARCLRDWRPQRLAIIALLAWFVGMTGLRAVAGFIENAEDDRALAVAVRALPLRTIGEVAFVDTAPRYGLSFYLGIEVERLQLSGEAVLPQTQDLGSELSENEGCRLLLVERDAEPALREDLRRYLGGRWRELSSAGRYHAFVADDGRCRERSA